MAVGYTRISFADHHNRLWLPAETKIVGVRMNETGDSFDILLDDPRIEEGERVDMRIIFISNQENAWNWSHEGKGHLDK